LICTVDMACVLVPLPFDDGATILNVTPWGTESGADPILDWHGEVVVKVLTDGDRANPGKRNVGIDAEGCGERLATHWAHRRLAGTNMVLDVCNALGGHFAEVQLQLPH
jgi:hypothetical protein